MLVKAAAVRTTLILEFVLLLAVILTSEAGGDAWPATREKRRGRTEVGTALVSNTSAPSTLPPRVARILTGKRTAGEKSSAGYQRVQLHTTLGLIYGTQEFTDQPRPFFAFRGIPYAQPPVGRLRWEAPEEREGGVWAGSYLDATQYRPACPQYDHIKGRVVGQEDCLYLNVYTPLLPTQSPVKLPVLVFFPGVLYLEGSADTLGPHHLLRQDVILVTANYRLGALGFLSTRDTTLPGNYGALDQVAVLHWVKRNIGQFGGDPIRITLGGHSSGAALVHLHTLSPLSIGLFSGVVMMSGAGNCLWSVAEYPEAAAYQLARDLDCTTATIYSMKECLHRQSATEIIQAQTTRLRFKYWPVLFRPVVDGGYQELPFLPASVEVLLAHPPLNTPVPVLLGGVPHEGILFALGTIVYAQGGKSAREVYEEAARYTITSMWPNSSSAAAVADTITSFYYTPQASLSLDTLVEEMSEAFTDLLFTSCIWDAAAHMASSSRAPVYTYLMMHHSSLVQPHVAGLYRAGESVGVRSPIVHAGVSHGHDLPLIFSLPHTTSQLSQRDLSTSTLLTTTLATFVHTGSPQSADPAGLPVWSPLQPGEPVTYYKLSLTPPLGTSRIPYRGNERNLWRQTLRYVDTASEVSYAFSIATWVLVALLLLVLLLLLVFAVCIRAVRRRDQYPGPSSLTLRSRMTRNPSATSSFSGEVTRGMS